MKVKKVTKEKLQKLSTIFVEKNGVPLFIELPIKEIDSKSIISNEKKDLNYSVLYGINNLEV